jgi:hypothetical protein
MALEPLTLEQLISAPLRALVVGQEAVTQATADFISQLGFETSDHGVPSVRTLECEYLHPVPDPANPGSIIEIPTRLRVPLLTLLSIPNLWISEANIGFGANVVGMETVRTPTPAIVVDPAVTAEGTVSTQLFATYAPMNSPPGEQPPTLTVAIKVIREQPAEGLTRILSVLSDSIASAPASEVR